MNIFDKLYTMAAMRRDHKRLALSHYNDILNGIPRKLEAYGHALLIANWWRGSKAGRVAHVDKTFPVYTTITLAKDDDLCVGGMLFLEHIEQRLQLDAADYEIFGGLKSYQLSPNLVLIFSAHAEGVCKLVTKEVLVERAPEYKTERSVICYE